MGKVALQAQRLDRVGHGGPAGHAVTDAERAAFIVPVAPQKERGPVHRPQHGPGRHRLHHDAVRPRLLRLGPRAAEPAQLLFPGAGRMRLGHGERQAVSVVQFPQSRKEPQMRAEVGLVHCGGIGVPVPAVPAVRGRRVPPKVRVEEAVAREVVVEAEDVGRAGRRTQTCEVILRDPRRKEGRVERMPRPHPARHQVGPEKPTLVLVVGLVGKRVRREDAAEILGLDEARVGAMPPDAPHRLCRGAGAGDDGAKEVRPRRGGAGTSGHRGRRSARSSPAR